MHKEKLDNLIINELKMPTKIYIGDSSFLSNEKSMKENDKIFFKSFKCKSKWVGEANLKRVEIKTNSEIENADYLSIIYASEETLLNLYKKQTIYDYQKVISNEIITTSKKGLIRFNNNEVEFNFHNTGLFADIIEIYGLVSKLEGLIINIYLGSNNDFNQIKNKVEYLFNRKDS